MYKQILRYFMIILIITIHILFNKFQHIIYPNWKFKIRFLNIIANSCFYFFYFLYISDLITISNYKNLTPKYQEIYVT